MENIDHFYDRKQKSYYSMDITQQLLSSIVVNHCLTGN